MSDANDIQLFRYLVDCTLCCGFQLFCGEWRLAGISFLLLSRSMYWFRDKNVRDSVFSRSFSAYFAFRVYFFLFLMFVYSAVAWFTNSLCCLRNPPLNCECCAWNSVYKMQVFCCIFSIRGSSNDLHAMKSLTNSSRKTNSFCNKKDIKKERPTNRPTRRNTAQMKRIEEINFWRQVCTVQCGFNFAQHELRHRYAVWIYDNEKRNNRIVCARCDAMRYGMEKVFAGLVHS